MSRVPEATLRKGIGLDYEPRRNAESPLGTSPIRRQQAHVPYLGLVGHDADRAAVKACKAHKDVLGKVGLDLKETAVVHQLHT